MISPRGLKKLPPVPLSAVSRPRASVPPAPAPRLAGNEYIPIRGKKETLGYRNGEKLKGCEE